MLAMHQRDKDIRCATRRFLCHAGVCLYGSGVVTKVGTLLKSQYKTHEFVQKRFTVCNGVMYCI